MSKQQLTKIEYLQQLEKCLKKLPKEDFKDAMEYFTEYFEDADDEGAQALMDELGTPKEAARDLMTNLLNRKMTTVSSGSTSATDPVHFTETEQATGSKAWKSILLISMLVLFAIPIGAPLLFCAVVVLLCIMLCAVILDLCIFIAAFSGYIIGGKLILRGLMALPVSLSGSAMISGSGILILGLGILVTLLGIFVTCNGCQFLAASVKWIATRKKKRK